QEDVAEVVLPDVVAGPEYERFVDFFRSLGRARGARVDLLPLGLGQRAKLHERERRSRVLPLRHLARARIFESSAEDLVQIEIDHDQVLLERLLTRETLAARPE